MSRNEVSHEKPHTQSKNWCVQAVITEMWALSLLMGINGIAMYEMAHRYHGTEESEQNPEKHRF